MRIEKASAHPRFRATNKSKLKKRSRIPAFVPLNLSLNKRSRIPAFVPLKSEILNKTGIPAFVPLNLKTRT